MKDNHKTPNEHNHEHDHHNDFPDFCPPPVPMHHNHNIPTVVGVPGLSLWESVNAINDRVNGMIHTYNDVMANSYKTLHNLELAAQENGAYYGPQEVWTESGYHPDESATYTLTHKACVDRRGKPIEMGLHLAYGNTTNRAIGQNLASASKITYADKIMVAQPVREGGWYGKAIWNGAPIATGDDTSLYTVGFTRAGIMRVYSNAVNTDQLLRDTIENAMGVAGVLIQNGKLTEDSWVTTIPDYDKQVSRVIMGQNVDTREVIFLTCGNTDNVSFKGMTSKACAKILLDYGCDIAVELCEGKEAGAMDKGSLMFVPDNDTIPDAYCFWYISRRRFYKGDYERELAELIQNYGACIWNTYLNRNQINALWADLHTLEGRVDVTEQEIAHLQDRCTEAERRLTEHDGYIAELFERVSSLEEGLAKEIADREAEIFRLDGEIERLDGEIERIDGELADVNARLLTETENRIIEDNNLHQELENESQARADEDASLSAEIEVERQRVNVLRNELTVLQNTVRINRDELLVLIGELRDDVNGNGEKIASLQSQMNSLDATIVSVTEMMSTLEIAMNGLKTLVLSYNLRIETVEAKLVNHETRVKALEDAPAKDPQMYNVNMNLAPTASTSGLFDLTLTPTCEVYMYRVANVIFFSYSITNVKLLTDNSSGTMTFDLPYNASGKSKFWMMTNNNGHGVVHPISASYGMIPNCCVKIRSNGNSTEITLCTDKGNMANFNNNTLTIKGHYINKAEQKADGSDRYPTTFVGAIK